MGFFRKLSLKKITKGIGKVAGAPFKLAGGLFKKKAGGTKVGNFIRGVASTATGGLLGSGANMIKLEPSQESHDALVKNAQITQTGNVVGQYLADKVTPVIQETVQKVADTPTGRSIVDGLRDAGLKVGADSMKRKVMDWVKANWLFLLIPFGLLLYFLFRRKTSGRRYARR